MKLSSSATLPIILTTVLILSSLPALNGFHPMTTTTTTTTSRGIRLTRPSSSSRSSHKPLSKLIMLADVTKESPPTESSSTTTTTNEKSSSVVPTLPAWDPTNWTPRRIWNNNIVRSATILAALYVGFTKMTGTSTTVAATTTTTSIVSPAVGATLHMLGFGTWMGTMLYTTFVAGITMYKNLPRQTFGKLQSKLFPQYFMLCSISLVMQVVTLPFVGTATKSLALLSALGLNLFNQFYLEPQSTSIMFQRYDLENSNTPGVKESDKYKSLASKFGALHGASSLTNLVALIAGMVHATVLGKTLATAVL